VARTRLHLCVDTLLRRAACQCTQAGSCHHQPGLRHHHGKLQHKLTHQLAAPASRGIVPHHVLVVACTAQHSAADTLDVSELNSACSGSGLQVPTEQHQPYCVQHSPAKHAAAAALQA